MIRKHFAGFAASALALAVSAQAFAGTVTTDGADLVIKTKGGLEVGTTDKEFSFKINGRLQADADSFDGFYTQNGERSEEHTSELQSLMRISYAVFCLKKKKNITTTQKQKNT